MARLRMLEEADLPVETVILLIAGMTLLASGLLFFPVSAGTLPFYEDGLHGLMLVMFAMQTITMGKTPFGDMRRSKPLTASGVVIAGIGIVACFIPGIFGRLPGALLFLCFGPGGLMLLLRMVVPRDRFRSWVRYGGIFHHLVAGCAAVYVLSMLIALLLLKQGMLMTPAAAAVFMLDGAATIYLAVVLRIVYGRYPEAESHRREPSGLSADQAMILLMGVFMLLLGVLLVPVSLGLLPFMGSAQLGLLMVIFAVQMLASGSTPIGPFPRSWPVIAFGLVFAALGIISCIIPGILVSLLTVLVGVLNIAGGVIALAKIFITRLKKTEASPVSPLIAKLFSAQMIMNLLTVMFGASMLVPNRIPGLIIGVILAANGCVLLYLLHILAALDRIRPAPADGG